jgi:NAD(P)-dependent dehydrogenase (short-subunit alcohol dehydrogenase family)
MKLANKIALVTGAARGIGKSIAQIFASEGADVIISDVNCACSMEPLLEEIRNLGRRAIAVHADVTSREQVERMFDAAWNEMGRVDILVNNAGVETIVPFLEMADKEWHDVTMVNLGGTWLCSQVFCRRAITAGNHGAIINIGSIQAARVLPGRTHYAPSKLAVEALTRNVSAEVSPLGIRVNCIHPGLIDTPMTEWIMKDDSLLPVVLAQISMGRVGRPVEIAEVAAFLASDEARYVTGQSMYVDGGWVGK